MNKVKDIIIKPNKMDSKRNRYVLTDILDGINIKRILHLSTLKSNNWFYHYLEDCHRSENDYCDILVKRENSKNYLYRNIDFLIKFERIVSFLLADQEQDIVVNILEDRNYGLLISEGIKDLIHTLAKHDKKLKKFLKST